MVRNLVLTACTAILLTGCFGEKKEEQWHSFIYPDKQNTKRSQKISMTFKSLQECKDESEKQLKIKNLTKSGTFKCGLNCEFHDGMKLEICEKMLAPSEK